MLVGIHISQVPGANLYKDEMRISKQGMGLRLGYMGVRLILLGALQHVEGTTLFS